MGAVKKVRTRKEPSKDEVKIRQDAIGSQIKKDFLKSNVSYVDAKELPFLVGKIRQTDNIRAEVRETLRTSFNASSVSVGGGQVAVVKRPKAATA